MAFEIETFPNGPCITDNGGNSLDFTLMDDVLELFASGDDGAYASIDLTFTKAQASEVLVAIQTWIESLDAS